MPVTRAYSEIGQFDTQVLQAVEAGQPVPAALDYQHGPQYGFNTLRAAVFARDNHTCQICGRTNRIEPRQAPTNERPYRAMRAVRKKKGFTVSRGRRNIHKNWYKIQPGDTVLNNNRRFVAGGMHNRGAAVMLNGRSVAAANVRVIRHADGWIRME